jgi:TetR/AcrR family transcriptional regulator, transcriptional repressor for nem operon
MGQALGVHLLLVYLSVDRHDQDMAKKKSVARDDLLDATLGLLRRCGFHGFSVREVAADIGISSASLHHHFATKDDLCTAVVQRHRESWNKRLGLIEAETEDWPRRVRRCAALYTEPAMSGGLMVLLRSTALSLPNQTKAEVELLQSNVLGWLARMVTQAIRRGELAPDVAGDDLPLQLLAQWEGRAALAGARQ